MLTMLCVKPSELSLVVVVRRLIVHVSPGAMGTEETLVALVVMKVAVVVSPAAAQNRQINIIPIIQKSVGDLVLSLGILYPFQS